MSDYDQSRKFSKRAGATAEQSAWAAGQSYTATVENMRNYSLKMIDLAQANTEAVFELARQLATVKGPSDLVELWSGHARKQFEMLSEQTKELTALGQRMAGESAAPIMNTVNKEFKKASWPLLPQAERTGRSRTCATGRATAHPP